MNGVVVLTCNARYRECRWSVLDLPSFYSLHGLEPFFSYHYCTRTW